MSTLSKSDHTWTPSHGPSLPKHPQSMTAMGLGIAALAGVFILLFPILLSPFAWYLGAKAKREIAAEPERWSGTGEAQAGVIMGVIGTVILVVGGIALVVVASFVSVVAGI